ncbi:hypothetical protein EYZ11_012896 [Aspergillus tanneri]|uniref:Uncharacterized protein n=1 Tax=Aspergillus tanneri TaxID=1220188 RepID=A0A4S3IZ35_9EURO|nr:hypothetical protein EYZ11_012896 [Aspergillus tanneri]
MSFWVGDFLEINTIGVEVAFIQVTNLAGTDPVWSRGYGIFGELDIHKIPGMASPLRVAYKITKYTHIYQLAMRLTSSAWESVFGIRNLTITDVNFLAYFSSKSIKESLNFSVSACMMFGDAQLDLTGHYSKAETYLEASVGNLSWSEIVKFYSQLTGASVDDQLESNDINFENMYLKLSTKGVVIEGKVSFNGHTSVEGYLELGQGGISIGGGMDDFLIDGTGVEIKSARIDIFVASRESTRASRFSIQGNVSFSEVTVMVAFMTEGKKTNSTPNITSEQEWALFGRYEGNLRLKDVSSHPIKGGLSDLGLKNINCSIWRDS